MVWSQGAVIRLELYAHLELVEVSARFHVVINLIIQCWPVRYAAIKTPDVNKVKMSCWIGPGRCDVVDLEFAVWWCEAGLNGREIDA